MITGEAIIKAEKHLQNPPEEWGKSISYIELKDIPPENIRATLNQKKGFFNKLFNRRQWEITIKYNDIEPTLVIDAYNGQLINLYGPIN
jgi:hypothetical protein